MKVTLVLDHRCNLRCSYCYTGKKLERAMPLATAKRAVDFGLDQAERGWLLVALFGGEPLIDVQLAEDVLAYAAAESARRKVKLFTTLATNGTLLDERRLKLLKDYAFHVQVSLDGTLAAQDACRRFVDGRSSHALVVTNLQRLIAEGFSPWVLSVIDPANVSELAQGFELLLSLNVPHLHLAPNYLADWSDEARDRFQAELSRLGDAYLAATRAGRAVRLDPLHGKIVSHLVPGSNDSVACKFGKGDVAVAPSGRLYPCERLVGEDDREALCVGDLDRGLDPSRVEALLAGRSRPDPECVACELRPRCKHWCGCANFETTGDPARVSPLVCFFERAFIAEADRVAEILYGERDPTFLRRFYARDRHPAD